MSSSINKNVNVERRTWDKETYESRAKSRAQAEASADNNNNGSTDASPHAAASDSAAAAIANAINPTEEKEEFLPANAGRAGPMGSQRAFLKARSKKVDLEGKLGTSEIIDPAAASATKSGMAEGPLQPSSGVSKCSDGVGWHCRVSDCFVKDSLTYLDHINGKKHQRYLGYTMRVEKSTTEEVSGVLKGLAEKKRERDGNINSLAALGGGGREEAIDFEEVVRSRDEEALKRKADRARRREERKKREKQEREEAVNAVAVNFDNPADENGEQQGGEEEDLEEEEGRIDPNLAAMMGFSGFGGSRK